MHCANGKYPSAPLHLAIAISIACFAQPGNAITLQSDGKIVAAGVGLTITAVVAVVVQVA